MLRRDAWYEFSDEGYILAIDKWTADRESLATALRETGWLYSTAGAMRASEEIELQHVWRGIDPEEGTAVLCDEDGGREGLLEVGPITIADARPYID